MKRTVILGAGFGGLQAAVDLDHFSTPPQTKKSSVVSDQNYFMFTPLLPQIVSSYIDPRHIVQPVRDIRGHRHYRFQRDTVLQSMSPAARCKRLPVRSPMTI